MIINSHEVLSQTKSLFALHSSALKPLSPDKPSLSAANRRTRQPQFLEKAPEGSSFVQRPRLDSYDGSDTCEVDTQCQSSANEVRSIFQVKTQNMCLRTQGLSAEGLNGTTLFNVINIRPKYYSMFPLVFLKTAMR